MLQAVPQEHARTKVACWREGAKVILGRRCFFVFWGLWMESTAARSPAGSRQPSAAGSRQQQDHQAAAGKKVNVSLGSCRCRGCSASPTDAVAVAAEDAACGCRCGGCYCCVAVLLLLLVAVAVEAVPPNMQQTRNKTVASLHWRNLLPPKTNQKNLCTLTHTHHQLNIRRPLRRHPASQPPKTNPKNLRTLTPILEARTLI